MCVSLSLSSAPPPLLLTIFCECDFRKVRICPNRIVAWPGKFIWQWQILISWDWRGQLFAKHFLD